MAQPSSTHRDRDRSSSHHHHRTISSTTLLLVLSLILAVLAVMLSIPRTAPAAASDAAPTGIMGLFGTKRNQNVINREASVALRESDVAQRESEVAKRESDILAGSPAGVTIGTCLPAVHTATIYAMPTEPVTVIKEVVKEVETLSPPWWKDQGLRVEDLLEREARVSEREKEVARREEVIGKRESDATRREAWIMEHLMTEPQIAETTEEYVYEQPQRRPPPPKELPPSPRHVQHTVVHSVVTETKTIVHSTSTQTQTVTVPAPAPTRLAAQPAPEITSTPTQQAVRTTAVEYIVNEVDEEPQPRTVTVVRERARPTPRGWFKAW